MGKKEGRRREGGEGGQRKKEIDGKVCLGGDRTEMIYVG